MKTLFSNKLLILDVETTGVDPSIHACIEVGAVLLDETLTPIKEFSSLVAPWEGSEILDEALVVSGIKLEELREANSPKAVIEEFNRRFCAEGTIPILSGWNVWFDVLFLKSLYQRTKTKWPFAYRFLDVQSIALFFSQLKVSSQAEMIRAILGEAQTHRALNDAKHTAKLLRVFAQDHLLEHIPTTSASLLPEEEMILRKVLPVVIKKFCNKPGYWEVDEKNNYVDAWFEWPDMPEHYGSIGWEFRRKLLYVSVPPPQPSQVSAFQAKGFEIQKREAWKYVRLPSGFSSKTEADQIRDLIRIMENLMKEDEELRST